MSARTKIGDIYQLKIKNQVYFLQLVAIDEINLFSDVIVVSTVNPEYINPRQLQSSIVFYTHTIVSDGIKLGLWVKVGAAIPNLDLKDLTFKNFRDSFTVEIDTDGRESEPRWSIWTPVDKEWKIINYKKGMKHAAEDGGIVPATDIIYRIRHGKSEFTLDY